MGPNPNFVAVGVSVILGILVLLWSATLKRMTDMEFMLLLGATYLFIGGVRYWLKGEFRPVPASALGLGVLTAVVYASSFLTMSYVYGHPKVNLPIATAITAAYPAITALVALLFLGSRFTGPQAVFFAMTVAGVVGLSLTGKQ